MSEHRLREATEADAPPTPPATPARVFTFTCRKGGCDVGLREGNGWSLLTCRERGASRLKNKAEARAWAKAYAEKHGIPYAEGPICEPVPQPTASEKRSREVHAAHRAILSYDERAEAAWHKSEWWESARLWMLAARGCAEARALHPGKEPYYGRCAEARAEMARAALANWGTQMLNTKRGHALSTVTPESEGQP